MAAAAAAAAAVVEEIEKMAYDDCGKVCVALVLVLVLALDSSSLDHVQQNEVHVVDYYSCN